MTTTSTSQRTRRRFRRKTSPAPALRQCRETADFGDNPGKLRMLSYAPHGLPDGAPLVVVLHGCTQAAEAYAQSGGWLSLADRLGFVVLAPEQLAANNPNLCFNWFSTRDTTRGEGEVASIAAMIAHLIKVMNLDADRVFITGLSAGGAMTSAMLAAYPELFAGGAIVAGLPYGVADNVMEAMRVMKAGDGRDAAILGELVRNAAPAAARPVRVSVWHGDADRVVSAVNGRDIVKQWTSAANLADTSIIHDRPYGAREVWGDHVQGPVVELHRIAGLGHGAPLITTGEAGLGTAAPFMLESKVSSTLEIAEFWGLAALPGYVAPGALAVAATATLHSLPEPKGIGAKVMESVSVHVPANVQDVIAKALRAAGLMK